MAEKWPDELDEAAARWRAGETDAARQVWDLCGGRLLRIARVTAGEAVADDAVQEAFIRAWRNIGRYDARRPFGPWMTAIVIRECRRHGARFGRQRLIPLQPPSSAPARLLEAVDRLPRPLRETVALHYLEGYDVAEAAAMMGVPQGTVKSRLYRARRQLAQFLEEGDPDA
jgi:RNA polymerase sigma-70 factor (ECF subfamily)